MSKKKQPQAGPPRFQSWTKEETAFLLRRFAVTTNRRLAEELGRSAKSVAFKAAQLGLLKSFEHRSKQSRQTALAHVKSSEEMAVIGAKGGKIGGKARAEALSARKRTQIAKAAIAARWAKKKP